MKKRTTRTYTIDDKLYEQFDKITKEKSINKSRLIENLIEKFVQRNPENGSEETTQDVSFEEAKE
jgi:metal-responsive CopG/Arc/MetJ family transcriptional regulator